MNAVFPTVAFATIFILYAVEGFLAHGGVNWYYRFGIPLFRSTFDVPMIPNLPPQALSDAYERFFNEPLVFVSISENATLLSG